MDKNNIFYELADQINIFLKKNLIGFTSINNSDINISNYKDYLLDTKVLLVLTKKYVFNLEILTVKLKNFLVDNCQSYTQVKITAPGVLSFKLSNQVILNGIMLINNQVKSTSIKKQAKKKLVDIEIISANPTGFLHIGHLRNGVIGRAIGGIYKYLNYNVQWSYLLNDYGEQVKKLADSVYYQMQVINNSSNLNHKLEDIYQTSETKLCAQVLIGEWQKQSDNVWQQYKDQLRGFSPPPVKMHNEIKDFSIRFMQNKINSDLTYFHFSDCGKTTTFSEKAVIDTVGKQPLELLKKRYQQIATYIYEKDKAIWLQTSSFSDNQDRVLIKSNKHFTYFLMDLIYHFERANNGATQYINIWGSDHHGYINRIKSGLQIIQQDTEKWQFVLVQMLKVQYQEKLLKMSKRFGTSISLENIFNGFAAKLFHSREQMFNYITFFLLEKSSNVPLTVAFKEPVDFVKKNNFIYTQYCYVRVLSILNKIKSSDYKIQLTTSQKDLELPIIVQRIVISILNFPKIVNNARKQSNPSKIVMFLMTIVKKVHFFYEHYSVLKEPIFEMKNIYVVFLSAIRKFFNEVFLILNLRNMDAMISAPK